MQDNNNGRPRGARAPRRDATAGASRSNDRSTSRRSSGNNYQDRKSGERKFGERRSSERPFGNRSFSDKRSSERSFGDRNRSERPRSERTYNDKPRFERASGDKPYGERRSSERPFGNRSFSDKRSSERSFGDRNRSERPRSERTYNDKPRFERASGDKPYGERKFSDKRSGGRNYGERSRSFGEKKYGEKKYTPKQYADTKRPRIVVKEDDGTVRLNKFIANSGVCSRREADTYIQAGLVTVNGVIVTELGTKVKLTDDIRFSKERLKGEKKVYIVMNKPKNFVTTMSDPHAEKSVMDLITSDTCKERVFPVGRLDKATTGVLMFTNDGPLAEKLTHPSYYTKKIYHVSLDKNFKKPDFDAVLSGITLEDGIIAADALSYVNESSSEVGIEIHSGRNRIVRRIFEQLGYKVKKLDRVYFAGLTKKNLKRGQWRFLDEAEINHLLMGNFD